MEGLVAVALWLLMRMLVASGARAGLLVARGAIISIPLRRRACAHHYGASSCEGGCPVAEIGWRCAEPKTAVRRDMEITQTNKTPRVPVPLVDFRTRTI